MSNPRDPARLRALADECESIISRRADCLRIQEAAAFAEVASLLRALADEQEKAGRPADRAEFYEWIEQALLDYRDIRGKVCRGCGGWGVKAYANTSTWRGGIGGNAITHDVCNECWGSGDSERPWPGRKP